MVDDRQGRWTIQGPACSAFTVVLGVSAGVLTHIVLSEKVRGEPWLLCTQIGVRPQAWISRPLCCLYDTERIAQPLTCFLLWGQECRPPQACCCLKQATQSLLWRQAHRPHVGGRCPRRRLPLCGLTALLPRAPPSAFPRDSPPLLSSSPLLSLRPESPSQCPGSGLGRRSLHVASCCLLSWALAGPSVLQGQIQTPPRLVLIHPHASPFRGAVRALCRVCEQL